MENMYINHWAVLVATVSDFLVGALWYSPLLFAKPWMAVNNFSEEDLKKGNMGVIFGLTFVLSLIISYNLAFFLGDDATTATWGLTAGLLAGVGFVATGFTIVSLFEKRSLKYILINCGYLIVGFALKGWIIGVWR
ncbi:DUF1761 domain-containing protein [bacterium]|nr:DUF1761 domain-containing protein [bacterium]